MNDVQSLLMAALLVPLCITCLLFLSTDLIKGMEEDWDIDPQPYLTPEERMVKLDADLKAAQERFHKEHMT